MNRRGSLYQVENPYPFYNKVVIVAIPSNVADLKAGDIAIIDPGFKFVEVFSEGDDAYIKVNGFVHPEDTGKYPHYPTEPEDENYGYFLVPNHLIKILL